MAVMRVDHPDILEFIDAKAECGKFENFNFSVGITDEFMERVMNKDPRPWMCEWKGEKMKPRMITRDSAGRIADISEVTLTASELMDQIIFSAWRNGEPGCIFIDTVNRTNPLPGLGRIECCNPCGEQYLHSGDACNLGAINLEKFVKEDGTVDYDRLGEVTRIAVRMLDNVVDLTQFPVERVDSMFKNNRRIGLGIMGLADMLFLMKLPYNSEAGRNAASEVMAFTFYGRFRLSNRVPEKPRSEAHGDRRSERQAFLIGAFLAGDKGAKGLSEYTKIVCVLPAV